MLMAAVIRVNCPCVTVVVPLIVIAGVTEGVTVTITVSEVVQMAFVSDRKYRVVTVGFTVGLADAELNPAGLDVHEYV